MCRWAIAGLDAWDDVRPDVKACALQADHRDADAEKLADLERDGRARGVAHPKRWPPAPVLKAPYKRDADQSAARSCVAGVIAGAWALPELLAWVRLKRLLEAALERRRVAKEELQPPEPDVPKMGMAVA